LKKRSVSVSLSLVPVTAIIAMLTADIARPVVAFADSPPVTIKTEVLSSKNSTGVDVSSLLNKFRDYSVFSTGDLTKDTAYALNIV